MARQVRLSSYRERGDTEATRRTKLLLLILKGNCVSVLGEGSSWLHEPVFKITAQELQYNSV